MDERQSFGQSHPVLAAVLLGSVVLAATLMTVLAITLESTPPEFSATVSSFDGLDRRAGAPPTFHVKSTCASRTATCGGTASSRRARWWSTTACPSPARQRRSRRALRPGAERRGRALRGHRRGAGDARRPDQLYERLDGLRRRQERVPLAVRLMLEEKDTVKQVRPWLLRCTAMLDGRPDLPSRCLLFFLVEPGSSYYK
ncbi:hypothetical protein ACQJBY_028146 [Aegilops geniculata]